MSNDLQKPQQSEEVDLGQIFKLIGDAFDRLFKFVGSIFKAVFSVIIFSIKAVLDNYKIIVLTLVVSAIIGLVLEKKSPVIYKSQMLVKPYFDSKYQLVTNINYYNALIREKDHKQLKELFGIDLKDAGEIINFEINPGPETENDRIVQYDEFVRSIDSVRAQDISFEDYVKNRSIFSGEIFEINVTSTKKDIFRSLEEGLNSTFTNTYSKKKMQKRDSLITIEKERVLISLKDVDSLKRVYINVMELESKSDNSGHLVSSKDGVILNEKTKTREYELLEKQIELQQELSALESQKVEEDVFFDTISSFQDVGAKYQTIFMKYSLIFPFIAFVVLCILFLGVRFVRFAKSYEG
ncbi:hypothetical protein [Mariniflexile sp. AS56]|uniref:hypothetical protein n=1 Tax=Mariniflexile sp. AS56 TaxID=3063957 RepID=UPI0026F35149|nr:hypothetical protein [Mariniflexile sp. AS56]MDO7172150.1 hypothetical protein [Mariniflexile sp. AS56]